MKISTIIGARPQFIKATSVSRILNKPENFNERIIHTGQHYDSDMSEIFFKELGIPKPAYHLNVGSGTHGAQTGKMLEKIEEVLIKESPDVVLVYGDTNSTLAGALAAAKMHIPLAHVEAGLRSFNKMMPEEINRVLTDHVSDLLFTPTQTANDNLIREGISTEKIIYVGDVMYDAALYYGSLAENRSEILSTLGLKSGDYILSTIHRAENTDNTETLYKILQALNHVSREIPVVLPLHPRTRVLLERNENLKNQLRNIIFINPVGYIDMVMLEKNAALIATDSGGVQKEAFFYEVPCVTLRRETEWVELIELKWNLLVPPDSSTDIVAGILKAMGSRGIEGKPYGDGDAANKIVACLRGIKL